MPQRYIDAIIKYLSSRDYQPLKPRQLARQMGVGEEDYGSFREAVKRLRDSGRVVLGEKNALTLPEMTGKIVGVYRAHPRGFGFVIPDTPNAHGDLFIPRSFENGALNGDRVLARAKKKGKRRGQTVYEGKIVEILRRADSKFVGVLHQSDDTWFVLPEGKGAISPIVIRDIGTAQQGQKVVAEIVEYPKRGELPSGVIVETLGEEGRLDVETNAVIRAHGIADEFGEAALQDARSAVDGFDAKDPNIFAGREDCTDMTIVTIDPPDARDYDDAISLQTDSDGCVTLGVHIADVSHFVPEGGDLDTEARDRATSVYFPRRVVPMLPEILSNGVCSLQEGENRFCKSAFITYDASGNRIKSRLAETVIRSSKRLTYRDAQQICEGQSRDYDKSVVELVRRMEQLARSVEQRRREDGMIHLDLPEVELELDKKGRVVDAHPEDESYSHRVIEMFMVEANEVVAEKLDQADRPVLRRVHPEPGGEDMKQAGTFIRACGYKIPKNLTRKDLQEMLSQVQGQPEQYAVNLAVLKTFQQAEYSPMRIGHFALASEHYCHFTSPIRRYPDLTVHRLIADYCRGNLDQRPPEDISELTKLGEHCSAASREAESAERELRELLVLQYLEGKLGEAYEGVVTGVTNFGVFVQLEQFLVEGLIRMEDLGDDWWDLDAKRGAVRGERSGKAYRIGDALEVRIAMVDTVRRQMNLVPTRNQHFGEKGSKKQRGNGRPKKKKSRRVSPPPGTKENAKEQLKKKRPAGRGGEGKSKKRKGGSRKKR